MDNLTDSQFDSVLNGIDISDGSFGDGNNDDQEVITIEEAVKRLTESWQNEQASPKLLPTQYDILLPLVEQIEEFEKDTIKYTEEQKLDLAFNIRRMEVSRLQYIINSYLRTRLHKMEKDPVGVLKEHEDRINELPNPRDPLLDENEVEFAEKYFESYRKLMLDEFLGPLAPTLQRIPRIPDKNANARVFFEVLIDNCESITVPKLKDKELEYVVALSKGDRYLAPFKCVEELLEKGHVKLI